MKIFNQRASIKLAAVVVVREGGMAETHNLSFVYSALPTKITKAGREEKKIFGCRTLCCKTCVVSKTKKVYEECTLLVILPSITLHLMPGLRNKSNREN